jgi:hypothetical protein
VSLISSGYGSTLERLGMPYCSGHGLLTLNILSGAGNSSPNKTVAGGDGCNRLSVLLVTQHPWFSALRDWVTWGISVAVSAFLLSTFGRRRDVSAHVQMIGMSWVLESFQPLTC